MRFIVVFLAILAWVGASVSVRSLDVKLVPFQTPVSNGFAVSLDLPKTTNWERNLSGSGRAANLRLTWTGAFKGTVPPHIQIHTFLKKQPTTLEQLIKDFEENSKNHAGREIDNKGLHNIRGKDFFFYTYSVKNCTTGKCFESKKIRYIGVLHDKFYVKFIYNADGPEDFEMHKPLFDKIIQTVELTPESDIDPQNTSRYYTSPNVTISLRRDYYLKTFFTLAMPPGWSSDELFVQPATAGDERGKLVVRFFNGSKSPTPSEPYEAFYVAVDGLPFSDLRSADYLTPANEYLSALLAEHKTIETPSLEALALRKDGRGFCLSNVAARYLGNSNGTHVHTYSGKNSFGRDLKLRIISGGGLTQTCSIIHVADPQIFDAAQERINTLIGSINLTTTGPSLTAR